MKTEADIRYEYLKRLFDDHMNELKTIKAELDNLEFQLGKKNSANEDQQKIAGILATIRPNEDAGSA